jgi:hypothetical protein
MGFSLRRWRLQYPQPGVATFHRNQWQPSTGISGRFGPESVAAFNRNRWQPSTGIRTARQRYECHDCDTRFDDLTDTIFAGHHQPLKVWILCLYFMGLNVSNEQIAQELALNGSDVQQMTAQLRAGIEKKSPQ